MSHYEERLARDVADLKRRLSALGVLLDAALEGSVRSFLQRDRDLASATILGDRAVNRATREIDRLCHAFVVRHLPSAGHLRYISAVLRLCIALERIGDYAVSISREAIQSRSPTPGTVARDIEMMAEQSRAVFRQAVKAFEEQNPDLARGTMAMEIQSNAAYRKVYRDLLAEAETRGVPVRDLFAFLVILGRLERIADQAKNICEETIFAVTGEAKQPRPFRILFLDERGAGAGVMAHAIARKGWPKGATFESAGWDPAPALDPGLAEFLDARGHDLREIAPRRMPTAYEDLRGVDIVVALVPGARERIEHLPYGTVLLDWHAEVPAGGEGAGDGGREELYRRLASRIRDLMETLCGEQAG